MLGCTTEKSRDYQDQDYDDDEIEDRVEAGITQTSSVGVVGAGISDYQQGLVRPTRVITEQVPTVVDADGIHDSVDIDIVGGVDRMVMV